jgi:hypothetical protein
MGPMVNYERNNSADEKKKKKKYKLREGHKKTKT